MRPAAGTAELVGDAPPPVGQVLGQRIEQPDRALLAVTLRGADDERPPVDQDGLPDRGGKGSNATARFLRTIARKHHPV